MKLKLTPTRISILALSAFGALIAQELVRSDARTPNATPSDSKFKRNQTTPTSALTNLTAASPQPEQLSPSGAAPNLVPPAMPSLKVENPPAPPALNLGATRLAPVSVNDLPIDSFVAATLKKSVRSRPLPPPPPKEIDDEETKTAEATPQGIKDIAGHRAQDSINDLVQRGIVQGFADGTFRPNAPISEAQFKGMVKKAAAEVPSLASLQRPKDIVTRADAAIFLQRQLTRAAAIASNDTTKAVDPANSLPKLASAAVSPASTAQTPSSAPLPVPGTTPMPPAIPMSAPSSASPASVDLEAYTLGAGDKVRVEIFNVPEYSKDYQVLVNGTLNLHRVGSLQVAGMTLKQAERAITARYRRLLKEPIVDLSLTGARSLSVAIAGEIARPGTYALNLREGGKFPTITQLLREAGGMSRSANPRQVIIRRSQGNNGQQEVRVNLWELFQTGNLSQDLTLRDGDSIFVPPATELALAEANQLAAANFSTDSSQPVSVALVGEVARPGPYTLAGGKGVLPTLSQAIQQAGGIKQLADLRQVKVNRSTRSGTSQTIQVNLWEMLRKGDLTQDLVLQQGDTITVPTATALNTEEATALRSVSIAPQTVNINVVGEVTRPGTLQLPPNTPLNQALLAAGGFTRQAKKRSVELIRLNPNGTVTRREVSIDLARGVDEQGNPMLQEGDVLVVERSGAAKFGDTLDNVLGPVGRILPFRWIFGF